MQKDVTKTRDVTVYDTVAHTINKKVPRKELVKVPVYGSRRYAPYGKYGYNSYGRKAW